MDIVGVYCGVRCLLLRDPGKVYISQQIRGIALDECCRTFSSITLVNDFLRIFGDFLSTFCPLIGPGIFHSRTQENALVLGRMTRFTWSLEDRHAAFAWRLAYCRERDVSSLELSLDMLARGWLLIITLFVLFCTSFMSFLIACSPRNFEIPCAADKHSCSRIKWLERIEAIRPRRKSGTCVINAFLPWHGMHDEGSFRHGYELTMLFVLRWPTFAPLEAIHSLFMPPSDVAKCRGIVSDRTVTRFLIF